MHYFKTLTKGRLQLPKLLRHSLQGPDDAGEEEVGVERAQGQLDGVLLIVTEGAHNKTEGHAADALQDRQQDHPDHRPPRRYLMRKGKN